MCQKDLRWKLNFGGKIGACRENDCAKGATVVKQGFLENSVLKGFEETWVSWGRK